MCFNKYTVGSATVRTRTFAVPLVPGNMYNYPEILRTSWFQINMQTIIYLSGQNGVYLVLESTFFFVNSVNIFCSAVLPEDKRPRSRPMLHPCSGGEAGDTPSCPAAASLVPAKRSRERPHPATFNPKHSTNTPHSKQMLAGTVVFQRFYRPISQDCRV